MSSLSSKSSNELCKLLDEYGINHGPIVDSTRKLYEKKLAEAMAKNTKRSSDKTYYREEQEEVTYVTYRPPVQDENFEDVTRTTRITENADNVDEPVFSYARTAYQSAPQSAYQSAPRSAYQSAPQSAYQSAPRSAYQSAPQSAYQSAPQSAYQSAPQSAYQSAPRSRSAAYTSKSSLQDTSPATVKSEGSKSGGVPGWLRVLVFIIIAVFLYYVYTNMESSDKNPFRKIDS